MAGFADFVGIPFLSGPYWGASGVARMARLDIVLGHVSDIYWSVFFCLAVN